MKTLMAPGWKIPEYATKTSEGYITWREGEGIAETIWEVDPATGKGRHCGTGAGCFWTDWE